MLEVVKHYPQYTWDAALSELSMVIARLYLEIPGIHLLRAWPFMQLQAFVGNALGGKGKGGEKPDPKSVFSPPEFTPYFARGAAALPEPPLEPQHCWALIQATENGDLDRGGSWILQMVELDDDLERIRAVAEGYGELLTEDVRQMTPNRFSSS